MDLQLARREGIRARVRCCQRSDWRASWVVIQGMVGWGVDWTRAFRLDLRHRSVLSEKWKMCDVTSEGGGVGPRAGEGVRPRAWRPGLYSVCVPRDWPTGMNDSGRRVEASISAAAASDSGVEELVEISWQS